MWSGHIGKEVQTVSMEEAEESAEPVPTAVTAVAFHPNGTSVKVGYYEGQLVTFQLPSGQYLLIQYLHAVHIYIRRTSYLQISLLKLGARGLNHKFCGTFWCM